MNRMYLPVKILDKQWADELMKGSVYMRALGAFGYWNLRERINSGESDLNNCYRSDSLEGIVRNLAPDEKDVFFDSLPDEWKNVVSNRFYIDDGEKYTRVYCMYRLLYEMDRDTFSPMSPDMRQFGDTAVIITDPEEFLRRIIMVLSRMLPGRLNIGAGEVNYQDLDQDYGTWSVLCKEKTYEWQQEVRIFASLKEELALMGDALNLEPWTVSIGDIHDIALEVPADDLICGNFPESILKGGARHDNARKRLLSCAGMPLGTTDQKFMLFSDYSHVEPKSEEIAFWQQIFPAPQWQPITFMQQVRRGGQEIPRLSFHHRDGKQKIFFFYEWAEIHALGDAAQTDTLLHLFLTLLKQKGPLFFRRLDSNYLVNMGEPQKIYLKNREMQTRFARLLPDFGNVIWEQGQLTLSSLKNRNVFGMDIMDNSWCYNAVFNTNPEKTGIIDDAEKVLQFFEYSRKLLRQRTDYLLEGGDPYERFYHL